MATIRVNYISIVARFWLVFKWISGGIWRQSHHAKDFGKFNTTENKSERLFVSPEFLASIEQSDNISDDEREKLMGNERQSFHDALRFQLISLLQERWHVSENKMSEFTKRLDISLANFLLTEITDLGKTVNVGAKSRRSNSVKNLTVSADKIRELDNVGFAAAILEARKKGSKPPEFGEFMKEFTILKIQNH